MPDHRVAAVPLESPGGGPCVPRPQNFRRVFLVHVDPNLVAVVRTLQVQNRLWIRSKGKRGADIDCLTEDRPALMVDMRTNRADSVGREDNRWGSFLDQLSKLQAATISALLNVETHQWAG